MGIQNYDSVPSRNTSVKSKPPKKQKKKKVGLLVVRKKCKK